MTLFRDEPSSSTQIKSVPNTTDWHIKNLKKKLEDGTATDEDKARLELLLESIGEIDQSDLNAKVFFN